MSDNLIYREESYAIVGACFEVYNQMGCGFTEAVFQECLALEFAARGIPFEAEQELPLSYRGQLLTTRFRADFVCFGKVIVELKATSGLVDEHRSQVLNYLHATGLTLGLLVNFGHHPGLEFERLVLTDRVARPRLSRLEGDTTFRRVEWESHSRPSA